MLEKIGLPAKPSQRGSNWVIDASHCQGCSSQFTFLNRKHHCRRCGGLFCNSCTQHRMLLRGQGDSPVRICEPCKKLEEAAKFELRHGHKNRAGRGSSRLASRSVDEVQSQILSNDEKDNQEEEGDLLGNTSNDKSNGVLSEMESASPEELRQQAVEEKNKYKMLKGEGKSAEALKAFKRAKELERQAAALELQLRKNRRKALASSSIAETQKIENVSPESGRKEKPVILKGKEKDDLTAELRELGWSDMDIHDAEGKPATASLEGELLSLLGHVASKPSNSKASSGIDKSQVIALKKNALMLKREGKLAEAKEELKRAKILEKQLEEQELLADADDSDDELSALMRSLDNDKQKDFSVGADLDSAFDLSNLSGYGVDVGIDGNFDVTDEDMHDPELAAALQSLGWAEPIEPADNVVHAAPVDRESLEAEILSLKKEAVNQKRSGNLAEAMSLLKKAKNLEKDLDSLSGVNMAPVGSIASHDSKKPSESSRLITSANTVTNVDKKPAPKSRMIIQKELLALKKKALALRREGKFEKADEELKKGKMLEQQLEEMDSTTTNVDSQINVAPKMSEPVNKNIDLASVVSAPDEDVTDKDLQDPTYLSLLRNLGWQDEENVPMISSAEDSKPKAEASSGNANTSLPGVTVGKRRSKAEVQRELLGLKRKARALKLQGQETEAEEVLTAAKELEEQLAEMEGPKKEVVADFDEHKADLETSKQENIPETTHLVEKPAAQTPLKRPAEVNDDSEKRQVVHATSPEVKLSPGVSPDNQKSPQQQEILAHKRKALGLKREGKLSEAREELRKAKLLERSLEEDKPQKPSDPVAMEVSSSSVTSTTREEHSTSTSTPHEEQDQPHSALKPMSIHDRYKLQRECLSHKRNALKLRREGKTEEAEAEFELAKKLEAQLEEASPNEVTAPTSSGAGPAEDAVVEDLFDPQLLSALKAIGIQDAHIVTNTPVKSEPSTSSSSRNDNSSQERVQLEAQIKAEKVKALNLKRAGKQAEALDALRRAKQMEKKLNSLPL